MFYERRVSRAGAGRPRRSPTAIYVIYTRKDDRSLRDALDQGLAKLLNSGTLRRVYEKYGIWNDAQDELTDFAPRSSRRKIRRPPAAGHLVYQYRPGSWTRR